MLWGACASGAWGWVMSLTSFRNQTAERSPVEERNATIIIIHNYRSVDFHHNYCFTYEFPPFSTHHDILRNVKMTGNSIHNRKCWFDTTYQFSLWEGVTAGRTHGSTYQHAEVPPLKVRPPPSIVACRWRNASGPMSDCRLSACRWSAAGGPTTASRWRRATQKTLEDWQFIVGWVGSVKNVFFHKHFTQFYMNCGRIFFYTAQMIEMAGYFDTENLRSIKNTLSWIHQ